MLPRNRHHEAVMAVIEIETVQPAVALWKTAAKEIDASRA
jgi:hypothetical protein